VSAVHTPGPLTTKVATNGDVAVVDAAGNIVAEFFADIRRDGEGAHEEAMGNAMRFAAASDLLAFAEAFRRDLQERGLSESDLDECQMELLTMADAAIAKATGAAS
jgi:hypothetical protein